MLLSPNKLICSVILYCILVDLWGIITMITYFFQQISLLVQWTVVHQICGRAPAPAGAAWKVGGIYIQDMNHNRKIWFSVFNTSEDARHALDLQALCRHGYRTNINLFAHWQDGQMPAPYDQQEYIFWQGGDERQGSAGHPFRISVTGMRGIEPETTLDLFRLYWVRIIGMLPSSARSGYQRVALKKQSLYVNSSEALFLFAIAYWRHIWSVFFCAF